MSSGAFGRIYQQATSGTSAGSYVVPSGMIAFFDMEVELTVSGTTLNLTVDGRSYGVTNFDGDPIAATVFANEGETITWSFVGNSPKYRIYTYSKNIQT